MSIAKVLFYDLFKNELSFLKEYSFSEKDDQYGTSTLGQGNEFLERCLNFAKAMDFASLCHRDVIETVADVY